jgi:hypothetical protein
MTKLFWISAPLIWITGLILIIIALTNIIPENPLKQYRLIIVLGFFCVSGFIRIFYKKLKN